MVTFSGHGVLYPLTGTLVLSFLYSSLLCRLQKDWGASFFAASLSESSASSRSKGSQGEAIVNLRRTLDNAGNGVLPAFYDARVNNEDLLADLRTSSVCRVVYMISNATQDEPNSSDTSFSG